MPASARAALHVAVAAAAATLLAPRPARATDCSGFTANTCINDDTLWPHAGPGRFLGIGSTETVAAGHVGFGVVTTYLSRPIVLKLPSPGPDGSDAYAINDQVNANFLWAFGVSDRLELDFALPVTLGQGGTGLAPIRVGGARLQDTAMRDLRFGAAYAIVPRDLAHASRPWALTARLEFSAPTGDEDQFAGERSAAYLPSVAADYRRGRWFAGAELGMRVRPTTELRGVRVGTQAYAALGVGFDVLRRDLLSAVVEARALPSLVEQHTITQTTSGAESAAGGPAFVPAEWTLSVRTAPLMNGDLGIQAGGGGAIPLTGDTPMTTPRFRFTLAIRYAPLARDADGDGVLDADDACPTRAGRRPSGCPAEPKGDAAPLATAAPVLDLAAAPDVCRDPPDTVDGFKYDDGCPDEDQDKDGVDDRYDKCPLESEDFAGLQEGCPEGKKGP